MVVRKDMVSAHATADMLGTLVAESLGSVRVKTLPILNQLVSPYWM